MVYVCVYHIATLSLQVFLFWIHLLIFEHFPGNGIFVFPNQFRHFIVKLEIKLD